MTAENLPHINVAFNACSALLLMAGLVFIKKQKPDIHKRFMIGALISSALFLVFYLVYHYQVGSVPYERHDWTRPVYFAILIPHIILATVMVPFIIAAVVFAFRSNFERHRKLVRWVWPVWMFVSVSGVAVYFMLYHL